jgi:hypothetical protein
MTPKAARYKINYDEDFISDVASAYHHFTSHPEVKEGAAVDAYMAGKSPALAHFADQLDKSHEVKEGSCNMTMEGEYCPEHGLMECGSMYEMGTVAGSMAPVMGEGEDDLDEGLREKLAAAALAGSMAFGAAGAGATGLPGGSSSVDQSAGKPVATQVAPTDAGFINRVQAQHRAMEQMNPQYAKDHAGLNISMVRGIGGGSDVKNQQWAQKTAQLLQKYGAKVNEGNDDPMNSNSAITGAYYESKDGDALLARIKSLALIK